MAEGGAKIFQFCKAASKFFCHAKRSGKTRISVTASTAINNCMRIREITENYANNLALGLGKERAQDQRIMEKNRTRKPTRTKRLKDNIGYNIGMGGPHGGNWGNSGI
jgi:hypothetical protein